MRRFLLRVRYAWQGWVVFFRNERHGQIQAVVSVLVLIAGFACHISTSEWIQVLLCIALVLSLEMVNSAIEQLANHLHAERHPAIGKVKDMTAGAVLVAAVISVVTGMLIFLPHLLTMAGL